MGFFWKEFPHPCAAGAPGPGLAGSPAAMHFLPAEPSSHLHSAQEKEINGMRGRERVSNIATTENNSHWLVLINL